MSAVDNLYVKLLDSGPSSSHFLAEHLSLMIPRDEKWEKMRQALPGQVLEALRFLTPCSVHVIFLWTWEVKWIVIFQ